MKNDNAIVTYGRKIIFLTAVVAWANCGFANPCIQAMQSRVLEVSYPKPRYSGWNLEQIRNALKMSVTENNDIRGGAISLRIDYSDILSEVEILGLRQLVDQKHSTGNRTIHNHPDENVVISGGLLDPVDITSTPLGQFVRRMDQLMSEITEGQVRRHSARLRTEKFPKTTGHTHNSGAYSVSVAFLGEGSFVEIDGKRYEAGTGEVVVFADGDTAERQTGSYENAVFHGTVDDDQPRLWLGIVYEYR